MCVTDMVRFNKAFLTQYHGLNYLRTTFIFYFFLTALKVTLQQVANMWLSLVGTPESR